MIIKAKTSLLFFILSVIYQWNVRAFTIGCKSIPISRAKSFSSHTWRAPATFIFERGNEKSPTIPFAKSSTSLFSSTTILTLELEKPLGLILEEVEEGSPKGVKVEEISEAGSAYDSKYKDILGGLKVASVMDQDVKMLGFDDVMDKIINAPSPVKIGFELPDEGMVTSEIEGASPSTPMFEVGETVNIEVIQEGNPTKNIQARVGDNLRKTLLENEVELYRGLKKKLGNCGGGGQCTFCAVEFVDNEGWSDRSDYEEGKIGKLPNARLACLNNIQGPATIRVQ